MSSIFWWLSSVEFIPYSHQVQLVVGIWWGGGLFHSVTQGPRPLLSRTVPFSRALASSPLSQRMWEESVWRFSWARQGSGMSSFCPRSIGQNNHMSTCLPGRLESWSSCVPRKQRNPWGHKVYNLFIGSGL